MLAVSNVLQGFKIAWCSNALVTTQPCFVPISLITKLSPSVPPEVKYISSGSAFIQAAISTLAFQVLFWVHELKNRVEMDCQNCQATKEA